MQNGFYVYEHVRLDTMKPFYVGKGSGTRAYKKQGRNQYWQNVVGKHGYIVNIIAENLDEEMAFLVEMGKIDQLRRLGIGLTNATNGGEGTSGRICSEESKKKMSATMTGRKMSDKQKKWLSDTRKGVPSKLGTGAKISASLKGKPKSAEHTMKSVLARRGKKRTPEQIQRMKENRKPCVVTDETRAKLSASNKGKKRSEETKLRMSIAQKIANSRVVTCNYCGKTGKFGGMKVWHFDNCKKRG